MFSSDLDVSATGNIDFVTNALRWLQDKAESLSITPKASKSYLLGAVPASTLLIFASIAIIVLPLLTLVIGLVMWLRRRNG